MGDMAWVMTENAPSNSRLKRGRGDGCEVASVKTKKSPSDSLLKQGREQGGGQDNNLKLFVNINFYYHKRLTCPPSDSLLK